MSTKPTKKRSEVEEMIFEELKRRHPALEMVRLYHDGSELARFRNNFEIVEG